MSYRCQVCGTAVPAGKPRLVYHLLGNTGQIVQEVPVCNGCRLHLAAGTPFRELWEDCRDRREGVWPRPTTVQLAGAVRVPVPPDAVSVPAEPSPACPLPPRRVMRAVPPAARLLDGMRRKQVLVFPPRGLPLQPRSDSLHPEGL